MDFTPLLFARPKRGEASFRDLDHGPTLRDANPRRIQDPCVRSPEQQRQRLILIRVAAQAD